MPANGCQPPNHTKHRAMLSNLHRASRMMLDPEFEFQGREGQAKFMLVLSQSAQAKALYPCSGHESIRAHAINQLLVGNYTYCTSAGIERLAICAVHGWAQFKAERASRLPL